MSRKSNDLEVSGTFLALLQIHKADPLRTFIRAMLIAAICALPLPHSFLCLLTHHYGATYSSRPKTEEVVSALVPSVSVSTWEINWRILTYSVLSGDRKNWPGDIDPGFGFQLIRSALNQCYSTMLTDVDWTFPSTLEFKDPEGFLLESFKKKLQTLATENLACGDFCHKAPVSSGSRRHRRLRLLPPRERMYKRAQ